MIKVRIPYKEIPTFKSFCKIFALHLEKSTGTRLRGNVLLNLMARAAGHDSYTALIIDAKTYGDGKITWESLPQLMHTYVATETGVKPTLCHSVMCNALMTNKPDALSNDQYNSPYENEFFSNRANGMLSALIPALIDANKKGDVSVSQDVIIACTEYTAYCELMEKGELNDDSRTGLKNYIESFAEYDPNKSLLEQTGIVKSWGLNQAYLIKTIKNSHSIKSISLR